MTSTLPQEPRVVGDLPEGMVEYQCRSAIRDLIRIYGFEQGRFLIAEFINDEASGRRSKQ